MRRWLYDDDGESVVKAKSPVTIMIRNSKFQRSGHNLLEVLVAAGIFVLIAVGLSGVWVMYGQAMAKSGEYTAANHLARGVNEGLIANGYDWLEYQAENTTFPVEEEYVIVRRVRGRVADIKFSINYSLALNTDATPGNGDTSDRALFPYASEDICRILVEVRWHSPNGSLNIEDGKYNNQVSFASYVYKDAI